MYSYEKFHHKKNVKLNLHSFFLTVIKFDQSWRSKDNKFKERKSYSLGKGNKFLDNAHTLKNFQWNLLHSSLNNDGILGQFSFF